MDNQKPRTARKIIRNSSAINNINGNYATAKLKDLKGALKMR